VYPTLALVTPPGLIRTNIGFRATGRFSRARVLAAYWNHCSKSATSVSRIRLASYSHRCPLGAAIIALMDAEGPKPGPRGPYKKREAENSN
jgi:hypothetical protein